MNLKSCGIVIALVLIMFMSAIETSIVSLALPTMKVEFNVTSEISLIFAVYFMAIVIANPIVGELLDRYKIIYITVSGLCLFMLGSLLAGISQTFIILVLSRLIQGLGAGVMMALGQIVPKLAFEIPLRYKIMGVIGSVWGISSIIGPVLGGAILEFATWHWLFFVNIPIAILAIILVIVTFNFDNEQSQSKDTDFKGMTLFYLLIFVFLSAVMSRFAWEINLTLLFITVIVGYLLFKYEHKVQSPFVPVSEFNPTIIVIFVTDFIYAMMLMGYNLYMPIYLQEQLHLSPLQSGFIIFPISIAWLALNFTLGTIEAHFTRKGLYLFAFTMLYVCGVLIILGTHMPVFIAGSLLYAGVSFGIVYTKDSVITQEETDPSYMKRMMSLYTLIKSLGSSIGATLMGVIYAMEISYVQLHIHNIIYATFIFLTVLVILWVSLNQRIKK